METLIRERNALDQSFIESIFKGRSVVPLSFAMVLVLFSFSFIDFRCNGVTVASVSGYNLVFGKKLDKEAKGYEQSTGILDQFNSVQLNNNSASPVPGDWVRPNTWAILGLIAAAVGLFAFLKPGLANENRLGLTAGIVGTVSLVILGLVIENKARLQTQNIAPVDVGNKTTNKKSKNTNQRTTTTTKNRLRSK